MKRKSRLGCKNMTSEEREAKEDSRKRKREEDLPKRSVGPRSKKHNEEFPYIDRLSVENLCKDAHNTVLRDPGRRDLLYCMPKDSTSNASQTYRYSRSGHPKSYGCDHRHSMPYRVSNRLSRVLEDWGHHTPLLRDFYAQSHFRQWKWKTYQYNQQSNNRLVSKNLAALWSRSVTRHRGSFVTQHALSRSSSRPGHEPDVAARRHPYRPY